MFIFIKIKPKPSLFQNLLPQNNWLKLLITIFPFPKHHLLPLKRTLPKHPLTRLPIILLPNQLDIGFICFPEPAHKGLFVFNSC